MKLKLIAPLLLSLVAASAFAHSSHDDEAPQPPFKQETPEAALTPAAKPKPAPAASAEQDKAKTPADPAATEPKKTP